MTNRVWNVPSCLRMGLASILLLASVGVAPAGPSDAGADKVAPSDQAWREDYKRPTAIPYPSSNPFSQPKALLGRSLFFDVRLSGSQTHSCSSCHSPALSWSDGLPMAKGEGASVMKLRSPTLIDVAWLDRLGWDGKFRDLEAVAFGPILAPSNMNMTEAGLIARLSADPAEVAMFAAAFPGKTVSRRTIELALATYERSIMSADAPFDRWVGGEDAAIGTAAKRGFRLFAGKAGCAECHSGWAFTDGSFHDIGFAAPEDTGRGHFFPSSIKLQHAFKTPTLRDIAKRGPYMHDGSVPTLTAVIDFYNKGGIARPSRAETIKPLGLDTGEKADLIAFLQTLSGDR